jgi:hypothetical protein
MGRRLDVVIGRLNVRRRERSRVVTNLEYVESDKVRVLNGFSLEAAVRADIGHVRRAKIPLQRGRDAGLFERVLELLAIGNAFLLGPEAGLQHTAIRRQADSGIDAGIAQRITDDRGIAALLIGFGIVRDDPQRGVRIDLPQGLPADDPAVPRIAFGTGGTFCQRVARAVGTGQTDSQLVFHDWRAETALDIHEAEIAGRDVCKPVHFFQVRGLGRDVQGTGRCVTAE